MTQNTAHDENDDPQKYVETLKASSLINGVHKNHVLIDTKTF